MTGRRPNCPNARGGWASPPRPSAKPRHRSTHGQQILVSFNWSRRVHWEHTEGLRCWFCVCRRFRTCCCSMREPCDFTTTKKWVIMGGVRHNQIKPFEKKKVAEGHRHWAAQWWLTNGPGAEEGSWAPSLAGVGMWGHPWAVPGPHVHHGNSSVVTRRGGTALTTPNRAGPPWVGTTQILWRHNFVARLAPCCWGRLPCPRMVRWGQNKILATSLLPPFTACPSAVWKPEFDHRVTGLGRWRPNA